MQVTTCLQEILPAFDQEALVASLEKMACFAMLSIEINRVTHHQPMHPTAEIGARRSDQKMKMIPQQHIGVHLSFITTQRPA